MRGVFWNVRGIGQDHKKRYIREMILDQKLDFIGLSQTIKQDFTKNELHNLCGGKITNGVGTHLEACLEGSWWELIKMCLILRPLKKDNIF